MMRYEFIDHTADTEFIAYGKTLDTAFKNALLALFDTIADIAMVKRKRGKEKLIIIKERAASLEVLLWQTLQDALSEADAAAVYPYAVTRLVIKQSQGTYFLEARISTKQQSEECSRIYVKGVSRFDMKVSRSRGLYRISAVVDI